MESVATAGSLEEQHVAHLLVSLHQQKATGSLRLERAPLQKAVYLKEGQILFAASNDPKDQLASILVEEGKLGPDQMAVAQARVSAGNPLAKVLTELGYVSQRELADAARLKVEKILIDLYSWREGSFQFADGSLPKGAIDLELSTPKLLFNSMRRIQERDWVLNQFRSLDTVLGPTGGFHGFLSEADPEPRAAEVLRLADGVKSIKQIAAVSALGEFEVCKILVAAFLLGALEARQSLAEQPAASLARPQPSGDLETLFESVSAQPARGGMSAAKGLGGGAPQSGDKKAADFMIDDEPAPARPMAVRTSARPKKSKAEGGGGSRRSFSVMALALAALGVLGAGAYYFFFMRKGPSVPSRPPTTQARATTTVPAAGPTPAQPLPLPPPPTSVPGATTTVPSGSATSGSPPPAQPSPTTVPSRVATGGASATPTQPPTVAPPAVKPPTPTSSVPAAKPPVPGGTRPTPPPTAAPGAPVSGGLAAGQSLLKSGNYDQAAAAFHQQVSATGKGKFTIAVSINCDAGNVGAAVLNSGGSPELFILPARINNRSCYRVCWGLFDSAGAADRAIGSMPEYFRKQRPVSVATARVLR